MRKAKPASNLMVGGSKAESFAPFVLDWRKDENYPPPSSQDYFRWAWECLRRCSDYQLAYERFRANAHLCSSLPEPDETLDHLFTFPPALDGETLSEWQERVGALDSTYLTWDDYIGRMWFLEEPVAPMVKYDKDRVRFRKVSQRVKRNLPNALAIDAAGVTPIDYSTELAPGEVLVRLRFYAETPASLKKRFKKYVNDAEQFQKLFGKPLSDEYLKQLHLSLRLYDLRAQGVAERQAHNKRKKSADSDSKESIQKSDIEDRKNFFSLNRPGN